MGILPMRRGAILALQLVIFLRAAYLVKRTARMAVPLLAHALKGAAYLLNLVTLNGPNVLSDGPFGAYRVSQRALLRQKPRFPLECCGSLPILR